MPVQPKTAKAKSAATPIPPVPVPAPVVVVRRPRGKEKANGKAAKTAATPTTKAALNGKSGDSRIREAALALKLMGDSTRLSILEILSRGERNVGDLCDELLSQSLPANTQPAVSHHLSLLRHGKLVRSNRNGKENLYQLHPDSEATIRAILELL